MNKLTEAEYIERYQRHINLAQVGETGQKTLTQAQVLIIGMGGLGSPAALYLSAAGIGHLVIADFDCVDISNLQRQVIYNESDIGISKVEAAQAHIQSLNSNCQVTALNRQLDENELATEINHADVVLDCSDNFETRFLVNRLCVKHHTPLVFGAAIRFEGQIGSFIPGDDHPCYQCLYGEQENHAETCESEGVFSPVVGVIGSMQALQAMLILLGKSRDLTGKLWLFDGLNMDWRMLKVNKNPACEVCA